MKPKRPGSAPHRRSKFRSDGEKSDTRTLPRFHLRRRPLLSEGSVTNIYRCTESHEGRGVDKATKQPKYFAAKVVEKSALLDGAIRKQQRRNVKVYRRLRHAHICTLHSYFETGDHCFLVMEYCPNGHLEAVLRQRRRLTEPEVAYYLGQVLQALHYLHHKQVNCGHLQLSHCLIDRHGQVKLGGWGGVHGLPSLAYCAPELVCGGGSASVEADIWSLGVCLYTLLVGKTPFSGPDGTTTLQRVVENQYPSEDITVSSIAWDLIGCLLRTNPIERISIEEVAAHPFFRHSLPRQLPLWTMATSPIWRKDSHGDLVVVRPALDNASCTIEESWCCARFVATGGQSLTASKQRSNGPTNRWVIQHTVGNGDEDIALSYRLYDGTHGVCFADATQALAAPGSDHWTFVDHHLVTAQPWSTAAGLSAALCSKAQRLQQLLPQRQDDVERCPRIMSRGHICHLQQWVRTPNASVFILSYGAIQISFSDKWEIVVTTAGGLQACYDSKPTTFPVDLERRMEYLQDVLTKMSTEVQKKRITTPPRQHKKPSARTLIPQKPPAVPRESLRSLLPKTLFADVVQPPMARTGRQPKNAQAVVANIPSASLMGEIPNAMSESFETEEESYEVPTSETVIGVMDKQKLESDTRESSEDNGGPLDESMALSNDKLSINREGNAFSECGQHVHDTSAVHVGDVDETIYEIIRRGSASSEPFKTRPHRVLDDHSSSPGPNIDHDSIRIAVDHSKSIQCDHRTVVEVIGSVPDLAEPRADTGRLLEFEHAVGLNTEGDEMVKSECHVETNTNAIAEVSSGTEQNELRPSLTCSVSNIVYDDLGTDHLNDGKNGTISRAMHRPLVNDTGETFKGEPVDPFRSLGKSVFHQSGAEQAPLLHDSPTSVVAMNKRSQRESVVSVHGTNPAEGLWNGDLVAVVSQSDSDTASIEDQHDGKADATPLPRDPCQTVISHDSSRQPARMTAISKEDSSSLLVSVRRHWEDLWLETTQHLANAELVSGEAKRLVAKHENGQAEFEAKVDVLQKGHEAFEQQIATALRVGHDRHATLQEHQQHISQLRCDVAELKDRYSGLVQALDSLSTNLHSPRDHAVVTPCSRAFFDDGDTMRMQTTNDHELMCNDDEPPEPVTSPKSSQDVLVLGNYVAELKARCDSLEIERKEVIRSSLDLMESQAEARSAELEAAVATARRMAVAEYISKLQGEQEQDKHRASERGGADIKNPVEAEASRICTACPEE